MERKTSVRILQIAKIAPDITGAWPGKGNLKSKTESLLMAAQNDARGTKYIKAKIYNKQPNCKCKLCRDGDETVNHMISEYSKLEQKERKSRYDWVGKLSHWPLCKRLKFGHHDKCTNQNLSEKVKRI